MTLLLKNDQWLVLFGVCFIGTVGYVIRGSCWRFIMPNTTSAEAHRCNLHSLEPGWPRLFWRWWPRTWITKRYCKVQLFRWTQLIVGGLSVMMFFFVKPGVVAIAFVLYFLLSFIVDLHAPVFWSAIAEAVDYGQVKTGKTCFGPCVRMHIFCAESRNGRGWSGRRLAAYEASIIVPDVEQSAYTLMGIALMLTIIPGFFPRTHGHPDVWL